MEEIAIAEWIKWVFSGIGVFAITILWTIFSKKGKANSSEIAQINTSSNKQTINVNIPVHPKEENSNAVDKKNIEYYRENTRITFIDDDPAFKVVTILQKLGWKNTKSITDIGDLNSIDVRETHIFFVDIHGVGHEMDFKDEGLGLSAAIKTKYPNKKVVIYSSETNGERFHDAFKLADDFLPKNADPYQFERIIENLSKEAVA